MTDKSILTLESEAGFKALFEYATVGILVISSNGRIELSNPCIERLFGYSKAELTGQPVEILIPEAFRKNHVHHRQGYFTRPKARPMGYGLNLFARRKDGFEFPVEISLGHYQLDNEQLAVAFVTDVTESKRSKEELEAKVVERTLELTQSLEREKELNEMKSRFVAMASHEFRTPLSAILSSLTLIDTYSKTENEEKRKRHIDRVRSSVKNLTIILDDFLSLDKVEQGKIEVVAETFDLDAFAEDIIEELNGMLKKDQQIEFTYLGEKDIFQDKKILRNVFLNLLSNAIKYSETATTVHFSISIINKSVTIQVQDEGIGIPEEEQKNLFTKFYRAKNATNIQGTGLGLNIVKRYLELLGGNISFISKPNLGTTFIIEFPQIIAYENYTTDRRQ
ncbi:PAS domain-containing sensor histidine kinase [Mucilaginibacter aquariorum]|uniref:histidine kinase n=1 Tax=Mucilaginibacter aquariorum TaxID=2967225 RepID=A0ABT1T3V6_9SPHI|nr:PAS domain-containing sensor histidine kinase [Mucilaginibacter aquariorum]MCQ6959294.1 PAS domain-containing sensor histidine kinase [Mucilaginibacter aquariorum]